MPNELDFVSVKIRKLSSRKITYMIDLPEDLQRYLIKREFSLGYNIPISKKSELLLIPAVSIILPLALIKRKRIKVSSIDKNFYLNMLRLGDLLHNMYPLIPNDVKLQPGRMMCTRIEGKNVGLFYSGGLDSTLLLYLHRDEKPYLFTIWGTDIPLQERRIWFDTYALALKACRKLRCRGNIFIRFENPLNMKMLTEDFRTELRGNSWWEGLQVGVTLPSLIAPVANPLNLRTVYIAVGIPSKFKIPWGDVREVYETTSFADVKVVSDGYSLTRMEKARKLREIFSAGTVPKLELRSCTTIFKKLGKLNCNHCEKCIRTILELWLTGTDPNEVGFEINYSQLINDLKKIKKRGFSSTGIIFWSEIITEAQKMAHESNLPPHLRELAECLQKFSLIKRNVVRESVLGKIMHVCWGTYYTRIPISVREVLYPTQVIIDYYVPLMLNRIAIKLIDKFKCAFHV
jgi:hypothetical protein